MKIKANGKTYEVGEFSLGEFRLLKRRYGVERVDLLDPRDAEHLLGVLVVCELRENPGRDLDEIDTELEKINSVEVVEDDDDPDPTPEGSQQQSSEDEPSEPADEPGGSS